MATGVSVAVVTGANKGIGLQIVRELCKTFRGTVYLTGRDEGRSKEAIRNLQDDGLAPEFLRLDVNNTSSIKAARDFLQKEHGGLDVLVNNAGILVHSSSKEEFIKEAEATVASNFQGLLDVCTYLFPLLRSHARVVNVSSTLGDLRVLKNDAVKQRLISDDLTLEELKSIMDDYLNAVKNSSYADLGYPGFPAAYGAYPMSKIGVTALSRIQQRTFDKDQSRSDIVVNACHPGYVSTDMTNHKGTRTVEEGADTPVYLSLLPPQKAGGQANIPRGELVFDRKVLNWTGRK